MNRIPAEIMSIIEQEKKNHDDQVRAEQARKEQEFKEFVEKGRMIYMDWKLGALSNLPEFMCQYFVGLGLSGVEPDDDSLAGIGRSGAMEPEYMRFDVPGLAPIYRGLSQRSSGWYVAMATQDKDVPIFANWYRGIYQTANIQDALVEAELQATTFDALMEVHVERQLIEQAEEARLEAMSDAFYEQAEREAKDIQATKEQEAQTLLKALENDPVAIHLLKGFLGIRKQREVYDAMVEGMSESLGTMEAKYASQAESLRRKYEDATRRADEEARKASDLEDDLAKAKRSRRD